MSKNGMRGCIVLAIVLAVFSVVAFAAPFSMTAPFWIAYVFGVIAIAFQIYVFHISFSKGADAKSKFYGFPIARIGMIYLGVQLILSIATMCLAEIIPAWLAIIIHIIPIAFAAIGCITAEVMRDEVVRQDTQQKKNVTNMRTLQALASTLASQCSDESVKTELKKLADAFRYSDPVSSDATKELENELDAELKNLQKALAASDADGVKSLCGKLQDTLSERNRVCAVNK